RILSSPAFGPESGTLVEGAVPVEGPHLLGVAAAADTTRLIVELPAHGRAPTAAVPHALGRAGIPVESLDARSRESGVPPTADAPRLIVELPAHGRAPTAAVLHALGRAGIPVESLDDRSIESGVRRIAVALRAEHAPMAERVLREALRDETRVRIEAARTKVT